MQGRKELTKVGLISRRYQMAVMTFFGFLVFYVFRVNLSIAIVAMTANRTNTHENGTEYYEQDYDWNSKEKGLVLGAFFYGYLTTQVLGGILAPVVGAGRLFGLSVLVSSVLSIATPIMAYYGHIPLIILRVALGVSQGVVLPTVHEFWSHWAPPLESTKLLAISYSGTQVGTVISMGACGWISDHLGWPWTFYGFGIIGVVWSLLWFISFSEDPGEDRYISTEELDYLCETIKKHERTKLADIPWRCIFTSLPIWSTIIAHTVENCSFYMLLTQLPTYLDDISGWDIKKMGMIAAIPYLVMAVVVQFGGYFQDALRTRFNISTTIVRKIFIAGPYIVQAIVLLILGYVDSITLILAAIITAVAIGGFSSFSANFLDLAPQYGGITLGISNTIATLPGVFIPSITGHIVQNSLVSEWRIVFFLTSGACIFGAVIYIVFGSGELQPWAYQTQKEDLKSDPGMSAVTNNVSSREQEVNFKP